MAKELYAGIIVRYRNGYLMCHRTGRRYSFGNFDIPKVRVGEDEGKYLDACLRNLKKFTGIELSEDETCCIRTIGKVEYDGKKDLYLFYLWLPYDMNNRLECKSFFKVNGNLMPEISSHKISRSTLWLYPTMQKIFSNLLDEDGVLNKCL